ncbi:MAG: RNase J family beta-CASP ribonuclease [Methanosarcinales archaeon]
MKRDIGIIAVGGYNEVGRNMTAIRIGKDIIVMDMGVRLDMVQIHEDVEIEKMHSLDLIELGAIPDDTIMSKVDGTVRAIVCTHGHLDHIGAVPKLAHRYNAIIFGTPYTAELIKQEINAEKKFGVRNNVHTINPGEFYHISQDVKIEFIRVQHSIPDCVFAAIHTPNGIILYANDFKIDRTPIIGDAPDFQRLREIGKEGVIAMITESLNINKSGKTPSEQIAKDLVRDALLGTEESGGGVLITTFSSHIARLKSIIESASEMNRIPLLLGRSLERYVRTAEDLGYINLPPDLRSFGRRKLVDKALKKIMTEGKEKYLPIVTGHQGEPDAVLTRIASGETPYKIDNGDKVIFSASVIPTPVTRANRYAVETKLKMKGARIYDSVHVSGHASREDHWELLRIINPENVIPAHGVLSMHSSYIEMAEETGYVLGSTAHILRNGEELYLEL